MWLCAYLNQPLCRLRNTVDSYEGKLALQHKKHASSLREEIETLKRLHEEQMRGLYTSEQGKHNEMVCEYSSQLTNLKHSVAQREKDIVRLQKVSIFINLDFLRLNASWWTDKRGIVPRLYQDCTNIVPTRVISTGNYRERST